MRDRIQEFIAILRRNGLRISTAEKIELFRALDLIDPADPDQFRAAFSATIVKSKWDSKTFERLYDLYFFGAHDVLKEMTAKVSASLFPDEEDFERMLASIGEAENRGAFIDLDELSRALLTNDSAKLEELIRAAALKAGISEIRNFLQQGRYTLDILNNLGIDSVAERMGLAPGLMDGRGAGENVDIEKVRDFVAQQLQGLKDAVAEYVKRELEKYNLAERQKYMLDNLEERSFVSFNQDEIIRMKQTLEEMARKLKEKISLKRKKKKRGRFSLQRTLRANQVHGGAPFKLIFDDKEIDRPSIIVLCDISDSVRNASRFMLQFVYLLSDLFSKVRSFVFVDDIGEITHLFREREINDAIDYAFRGQIIDVRRRSDFGNSFAEFNREFGSLVDHRTSVIILGDARNNYRDPCEWALAEISRKARAVLWLNPESPKAWNFGDSVMFQYSKHCKVVREVRNLRQLREFVDELMLGART